MRTTRSVPCGPAWALWQAMGTLNTRLVQDKGVRLAVRIGIHTGLVVVGEMGSGEPA